LPSAGPLMMANAGRNIPPVMGDIAKSFAAPKAFEPPAAPPVSYDPRDPDSKDAMLLPHFANKVRFPGAELARPQPGDVAKAMMLPPASADAGMSAGPLAMLAKPAPTTVETKVDIQAPFTLTVNGDVKDAATLYGQLKPMLDQHYRDMAKQASSTKLYDEPHI